MDVEEQLAGDVHMSLQSLYGRLARYEANASYWEDQAAGYSSQIAGLSSSLSHKQDQLAKARAADVMCASVVAAAETYELDMDSLALSLGEAVLEDVKLGIKSIYEGASDLAQQAKAASASLVAQLAGEVASLSASLSAAQASLDNASANAASARSSANSVRASIRWYRE